MKLLGPYLNTIVDVEVTGGVRHTGFLIDVGLDCIVLFDGKAYIYVPSLHIQFVQANTSLSLSPVPSDSMHLDHDDKLSYRKSLQHSRGQFVEIYVTGNQSIHGYVTSILTDYFVFYSPIFRTMYIPMGHLKRLIPYPSGQTPYSLSRNALPPALTKSLSRTFDEQIAKLAGELVVFDLGSNPNKCGLLKSCSDQMAELVTAEGKGVIWNVRHIKSIHSPISL